MREDRVVIPGENVGVAEEYLPGENVYVDEETGDLKAKRVGVLKEERAQHIVKVFPFKPDGQLGKGDVVYAVVKQIRDPVAIVEIFYVENKRRKLIPPLTGILHVSNASSSRVRLLSDVIGYGDVIRATIADEGGPPYYLSIRGREFGVVVAKCPSCMTPMRKRGVILLCPNCRYKTRRRKVSSRYMLK
ncbi:exosome complex RNA-binding protein Csl4 [Thermofilum pendens]|uniref:Exosome complex component Csl4 n=1 Tax=Thermofilum pendens (strain DSM 2475 / Hrk 5) TaxID=368408 RepID=A1RXJ7_THEPD|nr:exosome complex RNA-binding protein Csl4 [Thermofilum pendens]ABL77927.1 RNA binding S1 domain protein [Thermofilum pendens Hrk 5]